MTKNPYQTDNPRYLLTITERTPMPEGRHDTNTYHVFFESMIDAAKYIEEWYISFGCLVSMTLTPFKE